MSITRLNPPWHAVGKLLSEVVTEQVDWLWRGRIPLGKVTVLDSDPGLGKSAVLTDAARVSVGRAWADGAPCEASGVVICSGYEATGVSRTLRPTPADRKG